MSDPKVYNKHHRNAPEDAGYIGRGSPYGNPFAIGEDGDRSTVIQKFREYFLDNDELLSKAKKELKGKDLLCFCKPAACHGDVILLIVNPELETSNEGMLF